MACGMIGMRHDLSEPCSPFLPPLQGQPPGPPGGGQPPQQQQQHPGVGMGGLSPGMPHPGQQVPRHGSMYQVCCGCSWHCFAHSCSAVLQRLVWCSLMRTLRGRIYNTLIPALMCCSQGMPSPRPMLGGSPGGLLPPAGVPPQHMQPPPGQQQPQHMHGPRGQGMQPPGMPGFAPAGPPLGQPQPY